MLRTTLIDDFGLKPLRPPADEDFHDLMAERYESVATIVASNLDFQEWDQAFPANKLLVSAMLDRIRHNAYCLVLGRHELPRAAAIPHRLHNRLASGANAAQA